jgi:nitroimidazol reductase NimA-like FMN-containing flavoprotein (pyridoxamine 5'-phosphate oxidase superfamily)
LTSYGKQWNYQAAMRRKDKEITSLDGIIQIVNQCTVCRLGLSDHNTPYVVPLNYGCRFENGVLTLFFHGAQEGRKLDIIRTNNKACFEVDCDTRLIEGGTVCAYGYAYKSVIGFGEITILETKDEKIDGLNAIMRRQTGKETVYHFTEEALNRTAVYKMTVSELTGKQKEFSAP